MLTYLYRYIAVTCSCLGGLSARARLFSCTTRILDGGSPTTKGKAKDARSHPAKSTSASPQAAARAQIRAAALEGDRGEKVDANFDLT